MQHPITTAITRTGILGATLALLLAAGTPAAHADGFWGYAAPAPGAWVNPGVRVVVPAPYYQPWAYGYGPAWREHEWRERQWRERGGWGDGGWRGGWRGGWHHDGGDR